MAGSGTPRAGVVSVIRVRRQPPECHTPCQGEVLGTDPSMSDIKLVIDVRTQVHTCIHTRDPDGIQTVHTVHTATRKDTDYCKLLSQLVFLLAAYFSIFYLMQPLTPLAPLQLFAPWCSSVAAARFAADGGFIAASSSAAVASVVAVRFSADRNFTAATSIRCVAI